MWVFFSSKGNSNPSRPPWDYIIDCQFETLKSRKGEWHDYYTLKNRTLERRGFRVDELNPFLWTLNDFTSKMIELKTTGRKKLLSLYFSLMLKSVNFSGHVDEVYDEWGFRTDGEGVTETRLIDEQGTLVEYKEFVAKANLCSLDVNHKKDVLEVVEGGKSKKSGEEEVFGPTKVKRSKVEMVYDHKEKELTDEDGVEKSYSSQYLGRADIPIENLTVSTKVCLAIIPFKVLGLEKAMLERFDPSLISLTVVPVEDSTDITANNIAIRRFEVIHGRHRSVIVIPIMCCRKVSHIGGNKFCIVLM